VSDDSKPQELLTDQTVSWKVGDAGYHGHLTVRTEAKTDLAASAEAPDYKALWKDGKLTGLVITGTNMGGSLSQSVMDQYLEYYKDQGFTFEKDKKGGERIVPISDLPKFFDQKVRSGEVSYLVKEAHSDGDDHNIFRMDSQASMTKGIKNLSNGKEEVVYLVFPDTKAQATRLISNEDFGAMVRDRPAPLVYFNTSCWSHTKAVNEIEAAMTPKLVEIPSLTVMQTFSNEKNSTEKILLDSFRQGKKYSEIREALKKDPLNKAGNVNVLMFPDQGDENYQQYIRDVIKTPLNIHVDIQDEQGKPYNIDQLTQH
jgi:hypothetical protein